MIEKINKKTLSKEIFYTFIVGCIFYIFVCGNYVFKYLEPYLNRNNPLEYIIIIVIIFYGFTLLCGFAVFFIAKKYLKICSSVIVLLIWLPLFYNSYKWNIAFYLTLSLTFLLGVFVARKFFYKKNNFIQPNVKILKADVVPQEKVYCEKSKERILSCDKSSQVKSMFILLSLSLYFSILLEIYALIYNISFWIDSPTKFPFIYIIAVILNLICIYSFLLILKWKKNGVWLFTLAVFLEILFKIYLGGKIIDAISIFVYGYPVFLILLFIPWKKKNAWSQLN